MGKLLDVATYEDKMSEQNDILKTLAENSSGTLRNLINTNKDKIASLEANSKKYIKTINFERPDANGNINTVGGEGGEAGIDLYAREEVSRLSESITEIAERVETLENEPKVPQDLIEKVENNSQSIINILDDISDLSSEIKNVVKEDIDIEKYRGNSSDNGYVINSNGSLANKNNTNYYFIPSYGIDKIQFVHAAANSTSYNVVGFYNTDDKDLIIENGSEYFISGLKTNSSTLPIEINDIDVPDGTKMILVSNKPTITALGFIAKREISESKLKEMENNISDLTKSVYEAKMNFCSVNCNVNSFANKCIDVTNGIASERSASSWYYATVNVEEGDYYRVSTTIDGTNYYSVILTDDNNNVIQTLHKANGITPVKHELVLVPDGAKKMFVNNHDATNGTLVRPRTLLIEKAERGTGGYITVLTANAGMWGNDAQHPFHDYTIEEYLEHWRTMINEADADFFAFEEASIGTFGYTTAMDALFGNEIAFTNYEASGAGIANASRFTNTMYLDRLSTTGSVIDSTGVNQNTSDKYCSKTRIVVGGVPVVVYTVKLCPSGQNPTDVKKEWTRALRQLQYQDIINDINSNGFTHYIIIGDFNAQRCYEDNEYQIFIDNGMHIANGGLMGWKQTLRDICADNIVCSDNIKIKQFKMLDTYNLNTDHYPIMAKLYVNP